MHIHVCVSSTFKNKRFSPHLFEAQTYFKISLWSMSKLPSNVICSSVNFFFICTYVLWMCSASLHFSSALSSLFSRFLKFWKGKTSESRQKFCCKRERMLIASGRCFESLAPRPLQNLQRQLRWTRRQFFPSGCIASAALQALPSSCWFCTFPNPTSFVRRTPSRPYAEQQPEKNCNKKPVKWVVLLFLLEVTYDSSIDNQSSCTSQFALPEWESFPVHTSATEPSELV